MSKYRHIYAAAVIFLLMVCAVAIKSAQAAEYEEAPGVVTAEFSLKIPSCTVLVLTRRHSRPAASIMSS